MSEDGGDVVLVVCSLQPDLVQETTLWLDLDVLGLPHDRPYEAYDELTRQAFTWWGAAPYVKLEPGGEPAHILHLRAVGGH